MEFVITRTADAIRLHKKDDKDDQRFLISVYNGCVPTDFNPERTCRMIEKMEEMFHSIKKINNHFRKSHCSKYTILNGGPKANEIADFVDYIEHGDKEETIKVRAQKPRCCYHQQQIEFYPAVEITKSKAIELGLIEK